MKNLIPDALLAHFEAFSQLTSEEEKKSFWEQTEHSLSTSSPEHQKITQQALKDGLGLLKTEVKNLTRQIEHSKKILV